MNTDRLLLGRRAQRVMRYHTNPTVDRQNVGAHSFGVCLILLELTDGTATASLLKAALYHDVHEAELGDVPSPAMSVRATLRDAMASAESSINRGHGIAIDLSAEESQQLRVADCLELAFFCAEDLKRGNRQARVMAERGVQAVEAVLLSSARNDLYGHGAAWRANARAMLRIIRCDLGETVDHA